MFYLKLWNIVMFSIWEKRNCYIFAKFNIKYFGGKICNNKGINNSEIYSNENSTIGGYAKFQRCLGGIIYSEHFSNVNLFKGEISDNFAKNNSKSNIISPQEDKITNIAYMVQLYFFQILNLKYLMILLFQIIHQI